MNLFIPWAVLALFLALSSFLPFATYAISLACFGLPHVIYELRYLDNRFRPYLEKTLIETVIIISLISTMIYVLTLVGFKNMSTAKILALLSLFAIPFFRFKKVSSSLFVLGPLLGSIYLPELTFLTLAFLHNLTPWVFLRKDNPNWNTRNDLNAGLLFIGSPLLAGFCFYLFKSYPNFEGNWWNSYELNLFSLHYLPKDHELSGLSHAYFSAAVMSQLIHYYMVLRIFPRSYNKKHLSLLSWPSEKSLFIITSVITCFGLFFYCSDFSQARSVYGVAAALHSSLEWPLIVLFLSTKVRLNPPFQMNTSR